MSFRTASGKVGAAKLPRAVAEHVYLPNVEWRADTTEGPAQERTAQDALSASAAGTNTKRLRFYEDAAKTVQRRMVPNFRKSFEGMVRTARRY